MNGSDERGVATDSSGRANYAIRHWRGSLSLGVSYWVNFVLLTLVLRGLLRIAGEADLLDGLSEHATAVAMSAIVAVSLAIALWQVVGVWRSSSRHESRGGRKGWAIAAKVVLALGVLRGGVDYVGTEIPTVVNAWRHARTIADLPPSSIEPLRGGREIEFSGGIRAGDVKHLTAVLDQHPLARVVHLNGPGGDLNEAHAMAELVRARGLDTYVRYGCYSACTRVFLAGRDRILKQGAELGFHAPVFIAPGQEGARRVLEERRRLVDAGVPEWFADRAFAARGDDLWVPTVVELQSAGVVTRITDGHALSPGRPSPPLSDADSERQFRNQPIGAALAHAFPATFRDVVTQLRAIANDGGTPTDMVASIESHLAPIFHRALAVLPDRQIVATVQTVVEVMRQLASRDAKVCRDWVMHEVGEPVPIIAPHLSPGLAGALSRAMAEAVLTAADRDRRVAPPRHRPPQLDLIADRLDAGLSREQMAALADTGREHPPIVVCSAIIAMYVEILRLPEQDAGMVLRFLYVDP